MREPIYTFLANDRIVSVRRALAENPQIPESIQLILAKDADDSVVTALSFNPNLEKSLSQQARIVNLNRNGKNYAVQQKTSPVFELNGKQKNELWKHGNRDSFILLALDRSNTQDDHDRLLKIINQKIEINGKKIELFTWPKVALLLNENTEFKTISNFDTSSDQPIQEAIAANLKTPLVSLRKLLKKKNEVRCYLANPNWYVPPPFFQSIVDGYLSRGLNSIKQSEAESKNYYSRLLKMAHKPAEIVMYKTLLHELGGNY